MSNVDLGVENVVDISKIFSSEVEEYLVSVLDRLLRISGPSKNEKEVLQYIEEEIKLSSKDVKIVSSSDVFGLLVVVPASKNPKYSILIDAHADTVLSFLDDQYIEPVFLARNEIDKVLIKGTGLDNRLHCGLLMSIIKYIRFEEIEYCALFSTEEENGMHGVRRFSHKIDIKNLLFSRNSNLDLIIVLDVVQGTLEDRRKEIESEIRIKNLPVIGKSVVPLKQNFGDYPYNSRSNVYGFWDYGSVNYMNTPKIRLGVPCCYMHSKVSYASISDLFDLMNFFVNDFEMEFVKSSCDILDRLNESVQKSVKESIENMERLEIEEKEWYKKYMEKKKELSSLSNSKDTEEEYKGIEKEVESLRSKYRDAECLRNELLWKMNKSSECFLKEYIEDLKKDKSVTLPPLLSCITH